MARTQIFESIKKSMQLDVFNAPRLTYVNQVGQGINSTFLFRDANNKDYAVKINQPHNLYLVANEFITNRLAKALGLRVPVGGVRQIRGNWAFMSDWVPGDNPVVCGGFTIPGGFLPSNTLLHDMNELVSMLCFDMFVANRDRHVQNLLYVPDGARRRVCLIDHDQAIIGLQGDPAVPIPHLLAARNGLACSVVLHRPCRGYFRDLVGTRAAVDSFCAKVSALPDGVIDEIVDLLPDALLSPTDRDAVKMSIKQRRDTIDPCLDDFLAYSSTQYLSNLV